MIGQWDNSDVIFAVLPKCLKLGANPDSFSSGVFPVYQGKQAITASFSGTAEIGEGYRKTSGDLFFNNDTGYVLSANYFPNISASQGFSVVVWIKNTDQPSGLSSNRLFITHQANNPSAPNRDSISIYNSNTVYGVGLNGSASNIDAFVLGDGRFDGMISFTKKSKLRLYKDTEEVAVEDYTAGNIVASESYPFDDFRIGGSGISFQMWNMITAFIVYDRELSQTELSTLKSLGPDLGGLKGFNNGDGSMRLLYPYAVRDSLNKRLNKVEGATDVQNNITSATNVHTSPSGNVVAQKQDFLFN